MSTTFTQFGSVWAIVGDHLSALRDQCDSLAAMQKAGVTIQIDDMPDPYEDNIDEDGTLALSLSGVMLPSVPAWMKYLGVNACDTNELRAHVLRAENDPNVKAIVLAINSPGGAVQGTDELAQAIMASTKPITANVSGLCCSAAYWVASAADSIQATRLSQIGSIGVYQVLTDTTGFQEKMGFKQVVIASSPKKGMGADGAITDELKSEVQGIISGIAAVFQEQVATGRGMELDRAAAVATGECWLASAAKELGLIDEITYSTQSTNAPAGAKEEDMALTAIAALALASAFPKHIAHINAQAAAGADEATIRGELLAKESDDLKQEIATLRENLNKAHAESKESAEKLAKMSAISATIDPGASLPPEQKASKTRAEFAKLGPTEAHKFISKGGTVTDDASAA